MVHIVSTGFKAFSTVHWRLVVRLPCPKWSSQRSEISRYSWSCSLDPYVTREVAWLWNNPEHTETDSYHIGITEKKIKFFWSLPPSNWADALRQIRFIVLYKRNLPLKWLQRVFFDRMGYRSRVRAGEVLHLLQHSRLTTKEHKVCLGLDSGLQGSSKPNSQPWRRAQSVPQKLW